MNNTNISVQSPSMNQLRTLLLDPTNKGVQKRKEIFNSASNAKMITAGAMALFLTVTAVSIISLGTFPIIASICLVLGSIGSVINYEGYRIASNVKNITSPTRFGNLFTRLLASESEDALANKILEKTLIAPVLYHKLNKETNKL